jgi:hypothetical protein
MAHTHFGYDDNDRRTTSQLDKGEIRDRNSVWYDVEAFRAGEFPDDVVAALEDSVGKFGVGAV